MLGQFGSAAGVYRVPPCHQNCSHVPKLKSSAYMFSRHLFLLTLNRSWPAVFSSKLVVTQGDTTAVSFFDGFSTGDTVM